MKFFVVALNLVVICSVTAFTEDDTLKLLKFSRDCGIEQGITSDELHEYNRGIENFIDDPKAQNFTECAFQKFGWIDRKGDFQESTAIQTLSAFIPEEKVKQCIATAGDNKANAFIIKFVVCYKLAARR